MSDQQSQNIATTWDSSTADEALDKEDFQSAADQYSKIISDGHTDATLLLKRSRCFFHLEEYEKAYSDATAAYDVDKSDVNICIAGGRAASKLGRFHDSFQFYQRGLKLDKRNTVIPADLKQLQKLIVKEQEAVYKDAPEPSYSAVKFCSQEVYPGDDELFKLEKEILLKKYGITDNAPVSTENMSRNNEAAKHFQLALRYKAGGNVSASLDECNRAILLDPSTFVYKQLRGSMYMDKGEHQQALADICAIPKQARTADIWKYGGKVFEKLHLPVLAEFWFRKATKLSKPDDDEAAFAFQRVRVHRLYDPLTEDFPVEVDFRQFGRAVFASEDIHKSELCFVDTPAIVAETFVKREVKVKGCHHCVMSMLTLEQYFGEEFEEMDERLKMFVREHWPKIDPVHCKKCKREIYCSEVCRDEAWEMYHQVICPSLDADRCKLYDIADNQGWYKDSDGEWIEPWDGHYSPLVLAQIWASIVVQVKKLMKEQQLSSPTTEIWATAKAPFRRFIAYGSQDPATRMSSMVDLLHKIFSDCGDGVGYDITNAEFNGRYYQATCNLQSFSSYVTPYHQFLTKLPETEDLRAFRFLKYVDHRCPDAPFAGLFPLQCCLNHSCENNVEVSDGKGQNGRPGVQVCAKREIKKGEELFTTYIDTTMPRRLRRAWLYKSFNFWCQCQRCQFEGDDSSSCTNCGTKAPEEKTFPGCGKCHKAWYCSVGCQKKAWKLGHKAICTQPHSQILKEVDRRRYQPS